MRIMSLHHVSTNIYHSVNYVNPINGVHTQHAESYNNRLKMKIKAMKGIRKDAIDGFLQIFNFEERHKENIFKGYLKIIIIFNE